MDSTDRAILHEVAERMRRTETRVVQLGDHMGANLRSRNSVHITPGRKPFVTIDAPDVSVSRIITALAAATITAGDVSVFLPGAPTPVATLHLDNFK